MKIFESTVCNGFPILVNVIRYQPGAPGCISGPPENCWPPEPPDVEFKLTTIKGDPCPWIEKKITDDEWERLTDEAINIIESR